MTTATASLDPAPRLPRAGGLPGWREGRPWQVLRRWWPWLAAVASGLFLTLGLEPWNQEWICWVALTPLIAAIWADERVPVPAPAHPTIGWRRWYARLRPRVPRERWVRGFCLGYITGLIFYWVAFHWLTEVTGPGWFILGFYMALYPASFGWFVATVARPWTPPPLPPSAEAAPRRPAARLFVLNPAPACRSPLLRSRWNLAFAFLGASAWTTQEWLRGIVFTGWGWNYLGVALHRNLPFIQVAEWTGIGGLSFLAAFVNFILVATVARFVLEVRAHRVRAHFDFTLTLAAVMLVFTFGIRVLGRSAREADQPGVMIPLRVACVQANIAQAEKWSREFADSIYQTFADMSAEAAATKPQLLLWPEASTPYGMYDGAGDTFGFTHEVVRHTGANLLFGSLDYDFGPDGHAQADYNAAMMLVPGDNERRVQIYRKLHLVPFGEYVPARALFGHIIGDKVPSDFGVGEGPGVFEMADPAVRVAPLVCFEDTIGRVARQPVLMGAQLLVNITNDGWFGRSEANRQQMSEAVFRTVENRRPLVSCANTGVTAFVNRDGRVTQILRGADGSVFGRGILSGVVPVPVHPGLTFYTRHGEVFSAACAGVMALGWFFVAWRFLRRLTIPRRRGDPPKGDAEGAAA